MSIDVEKNYYAILGISPLATEEEIRRAYRAKARRYHPDSREEDAPTQLFHEVQEAYAILSQPQQRQAYDRQRAQTGLSSDAPLSWDLMLSRHRLSAEPDDQVAYLLAKIEPQSAVEAVRLPLNLCLVIDCSTSMQGARLNQVKQAANQIIDDLGEEDSLAVVTFDDRAKVVLPSQKHINPARAKAKTSTISASGGTEILKGLQAGLSEIDKYYDDRIINHLILLTDGQTYGDEEECIAEARRAGARQIGITAMGIGEDWNDVLLDKVAEQSGGVSAYIASPGQVRTLLEQRVRGLGAVFAQDVKLGIQAAEEIQIEEVFRVLPYLDHLQVEEGRVKLGALQADASISVLLQLGIGDVSAGKQRLLRLSLSGDIPSVNEKGKILQRDIWCTFLPEEPPAEPVPPAILSALSKITIYSMQEETWNTLDEGNVKEATHKLETIATRLFDLGQPRLARAAMLEAGRIAQGGGPTAKGRKELKYGTRSLTVASRRKSYD